eukprot:UN04460
MTEENQQKQSKGDYVSKNKKLFADKSLLKEEWMECLKKPDALIFAWFCGPCTMANNCMLASKKEERLLNGLATCCFPCCFCGLQRSHIQKTVGVDDDGLLWNCIMHFCLLSCVSMVQEYRGVIRWKKATSEKFKDEWKKSGKNWWDSCLINLKNLDME